MNDGYRRVLLEMCRRVGVKFNEIDFSDEYWYETCSWSEDDQSDFVRWLADELMEDKNLREDLLERPHHLTYDRALKAAQEFVFNYGWKIKEDE